MSINIIQGEDRDITLGLKDQDELVYIDLTGVTEIEVKVADTLAAYQSFKLSTSEVTVIDATHGKFKVSMSDTKTLLFKKATLPIEVIIDWGTKRRIGQIANALVVSSKLF